MSSNANLAYETLKNHFVFLIFYNLAPSARSLTTLTIKHVGGNNIPMTIRSSRKVTSS